MQHDEEDVDDCVVGTIVPSRSSARARRPQVRTFDIYVPGLVDHSESDEDDKQPTLHTHRIRLIKTITRITKRIDKLFH